MALISQPPALLTIPRELRLMIWERVFPKLDYFGGVDHKECPHRTSRSQYVEMYGDEWGVLVDAPPCSCNYRQLHPLFLCKKTYNEMKRVLDGSEIEADFTTDLVCGLKPSLCDRIRTLTLAESVFPVVSCQLGFLEYVRYGDFLNTFPSLEKITMPEGLDWGMDIRFPSSIPSHIWSRLRSRDGPAAMPNADMIESVLDDLAGKGYGEAFAAVKAIVVKGKIEISSTYRYKVSASRQLEWPFDDEMRDIFDQKYSGKIVWDKDSMRINDIPDFRGEWWWEEWMREQEFRPDRPQLLDAEAFDWTSELGGWDLMDLLKQDYGQQQYWMEATEESFSFT